MKRAAVAILGVVLLAGIGVWQLQPAQQPANARAQLAVAQLESLVFSAPEEPPDVRFERTMVGVSSLDGVDPLLDLCQGPVAVDLGAERPVLVAEHDYCGGLAWMPKLVAGDFVKLGGEGLTESVYEVTSIDHAARGTALVDDLPDASVVLQTCVSKTQIVLVSLEPVEASTT